MRPPLSVSVIAWLYIGIGVVGGILHLAELRSGQGFRYDLLGIELIQLAAVACGIWLLRGRNWARWLALVWMGLHVVVSVFHPVFELVVHTVFFAVIAFVLFRPPAGRYFRPDAAGQTGAAPVDTSDS